MGWVMTIANSHATRVKSYVYVRFTLCRPDHYKCYVSNRVVVFLAEKVCHYIGIVPNNPTLISFCYRPHTDTVNDIDISYQPDYVRRMCLTEWFGSKSGYTTVFSSRYTNDVT